jgi:hypothetical protein
MIFEQPFMTEEYLRYSAECKRMAILASHVPPRPKEAATTVVKTKREQWQTKARGKSGRRLLSGLPHGVRPRSRSLASGPARYPVHG